MGKRRIVLKMDEEELAVTRVALTHMQSTTSQTIARLTALGDEADKETLAKAQNIARCASSAVQRVLKAQGR